MNRRIRWVPRAVLALSAAALAVGAPAAAFADPPGDNGTVKIHAVGTPVDDRRNEPHVCVFYLDAFGFDSAQAVTWHIDQQPPTGRTQVTDGTITLADGSGRTDDLSLPDGHYKLYWNFAGEHGQAKHKVFWVECAESSASPSASAAPSASASSMPGAGGAPSSTPTAGGGGGSPAPSPSQAGNELPVTGAPLGVLAAVALAFIGAGVLLRTRISRLFRR